MVQSNSLLNGSKEPKGQKVAYNNFYVAGAFLSNEKLIEKLKMAKVITEEIAIPKCTTFLERHNMR